MADAFEEITRAINKSAELLKDYTIKAEPRLMEATRAHYLDLLKIQKELFENIISGKILKIW